MEGRAPSAAEALLAGLRELQAKGLLCDAVLAGAKGAGTTEGPRLAAHQAVLAAASAPLCEFFLDAASKAAAADKASDDPLLASAPQPQELRLSGLSQPSEALPKALSRLYAGSAAGADGSCKEDLAKLAAAWKLSGATRRGGGGAAAAGGAAEAESICAGLRQLRAKSQLCDVVVIAGGQRFAAHQAVLAAASAPLRRYIVDKLRELTGHAGSKDKQDMPSLVAQPLELDLQGVTTPEALALALRHIYGEVAGPTKQPAEQVAQDLRQLAASLELPRLKAFAIGGQADPEPERDEEEEREAPITATPEDAVKTPPKPTTDQAGKPISDYERALYAMRSCRFASTGDVPEAPTIDQEPSDKADAKILQKIREAFFERPAWLDQALLKRLPGSVDEATLLRLLPYVAYQWQDGPWSKAYTRYGWDPRCESEAEEAKGLQVLQFRDPHFRNNNNAEASDAAASDCSFRKPPTLKTQSYQLVDIQDDYITSLLESAELLDCVDKKSGWLPQFVLEVTRDRLTVRSQQLREKIALRAATAAKASKGAGRGAKRRSSTGAGRGRGAGNKAKRTRVGGG